MDELRVLTATGVDGFLEYLIGLRAGGRDAPPFHLLTDGVTSDGLSQQITLDRRKFATRRDAAEYLLGALAPLDRTFIDNNVGVWTWLALYYFEQLCPVSDSGERRVRATERYVLNGGQHEFVRLRSYRHLLASPFNIARIHQGSGNFLLCGPVSEHPDTAEQLGSAFELITNRGLVAAADALYFDPSKRRLKRGATDRNRPGTLRRLVDVVHQLDLTFDLYQLSAAQILALLPDEFRAWQNSATAVPA